jgi:A/G-specific adenine glycosylase
MGKAKTRFFQDQLWKWYSDNKRVFPWRLKKCSNYEIVISEILLQRTRAETVKKYYTSFIKRFPSWLSLAKAKRYSIERAIKPLGLWRQRTNILLSLSRQALKRKGKLPSKREDIEQLPGIGQYIASAILLICHHKNEPLLDVNMARLLERYFGSRKLADIRYDPYLQNLSRNILPNKNAKEFNWAILDFAAAICTSRNPKHQECPLKNKCFFLNKKK